MKFFLPSILLAGTLLSSGCASIVSHTRWPLAVSSVPVGATISISSRDGKEVYSGTTPAAVVLRSGASFFKRETYTLKFTKPGFDTKTTTLTPSVNGWYFGNLVFGGLIGMLIIDPATGAMYRIDEKEVQVALTQTTGMITWPEADPNGLRVMSIEEVPAALRSSLVPLTSK